MKNIFLCFNNISLTHEGLPKKVSEENIASLQVSVLLNFVCIVIVAEMTRTMHFFPIP